jgi:hypothetical protein
LRAECRLRVFENRVLRRILGPKRDEAMRVENTTKQEALWPLFLTRYHSSDHNGEEERCIQGFTGEI